MYHVIKWRGGNLEIFQGSQRELRDKIFTQGSKMFEVWCYSSEGEARKKYQDLIDQVCPNCQPETGYCTGRCV